jgi:hypothetical protein
MVITDVFEQFLAEQQAKLAPKTYREYASVMDLFAHQLDGYGWNEVVEELTYSVRHPVGSGLRPGLDVYL